MAVVLIGAGVCCLVTLLAAAAPPHTPKWEPTRRIPSPPTDAEYERLKSAYLPPPAASQGVEPQ